MARSNGVRSTENSQVTIELPPVYSIDVTHPLGRIQQMLQPAQRVSAVIQPRKHKELLVTLEGGPVTKVLAVPLRKRKISQASSYILNYLDDAETLHFVEWRTHPELRVKELDLAPLKQCQSDVVSSWDGCFDFAKVARTAGRLGLRPPQMGAIHALHAHWSVSTDVATIVMPTGTGKTDTMLAAIVSAALSKTLVVVPTDALRTQLYAKFLHLGVLRSQGVIHKGAKLPVVARLERIPKDEVQFRTFIESANILVTTMSIAAHLGPELQRLVSQTFDALFVDEAHHVGATTWAEFLESWKSRRVVQFTATPFRNDGKEVARCPVYVYPLAAAQRDGYFRPITFCPVIEFNPIKADRAIAVAATKRLKEDRKTHPHVLLARVATVQRAGEVLAHYQQLCPELNPVQLHTGIKGAARELARSQVLSGYSSVVVCVDMLGEGFDLPTLKVAAFHDIRKNLTTTLQLTGRFVRDHPDVGDATAFANVADPNVENELEQLYQMESDWNQLLPRFSDASVKDAVDFSHFLSGFSGSETEIDLGNLRPAFSAVVFQVTSDKWEPLAFVESLTRRYEAGLIKYRLQARENVLVVVRGSIELPPWTRQRQLAQSQLSLFLAHFDPVQRLLFLHDSEKGSPGSLRTLASELCPHGATLLEGPQMFRVFGYITRLKLQSVGLKHVVARLIRYVQRFGGDVGSGLSDIQKSNAVKVNIFGAGYESGSRASAGCSAKGRIWSRKADRLDLFCGWCRAVGSKLLDSSIDPQACLEGALVPILIGERPQKVPYWIEWPESITMDLESDFQFQFSGYTSWVSLTHVDLQLVEHTESGPLRFTVTSDQRTCKFELQLVTRGDDAFDCEIKAVDGSCKLKAGYREQNLAEYFKDHPPTITFVDGSMLDGCQFVESSKKVPQFERDRIEDWDWTGVDITQESQGPQKSPSSVQRRVIEELLKEPTSLVIYDDDGSGEIADVVTLSVVDAELRVGLYHCKYSSKPDPGSRSNDLYVVGGQVQKSIRWLENPTKLIRHMLTREPLTKNGQTATRYERGSQDELMKLRAQSRKLRVVGSIFLVQPGLSKKLAKEQQLALLGVTENYLKETLEISLRVIASP